MKNCTFNENKNTYDKNRKFVSIIYIMPSHAFISKDKLLFERISSLRVFLLYLVFTLFGKNLKKEINFKNLNLNNNNFDRN